MKLRVMSVLALACLVLPVAAFAADTLSPYLMVGVVNGPVKDAAQKVKDALKAGGFDVIGEYSPEGKATLDSIVYTRSDLQATALKVKNRGALAAVLKVGLKEEGGKTTVSMVNPEYLFRAYLMKSYADNQPALEKVAADAKQALKAVGGDLAPFGGTLSTGELGHYHYMFGMEYFDDPVFLKKFKSFEEGVKTITNNLASKKGGTSQVFALVNSDSKVAVFGVGQSDAKIGEPFFLPIIGEDHLAAMPYEMILTGREATMLHGRYRIALHWPSLTMGTFGKIMSTPSDIEKTLKALTN